MVIWLAMRRRLFAIASVLSSLVCMAMIAFFCVATRRIERAKLATQTTFNAVSNQVQETIQKSESYTNRIGRHPSATELKHLNELDATSRRLLAEQTRLVALMVSPPAPPGIYRWSTGFAGVLPVVWLLWWASRRLGDAFPDAPNLPADESQQIMHEVQ